MLLLHFWLNQHNTTFRKSREEGAPILWEWRTQTSLKRCRPPSEVSFTARPEVAAEKLVRGGKATTGAEARSHFQALYAALKGPLFHGDACVREFPRGVTDQCGGVSPLSGGFGGGAVVLSSLKMPAIFPRKLFFFLGS